MKKGEETRQRIVEATAGLFNRKGYRATSMNDVLAATGMQKGGIYHHFASKEVLALAAFRHNTTRLGKAMRSVIAPHRRCIRKLSALFTLSISVSAGSPVEGGCPILNAGIEADGLDPPLKQAAKEALAGLKNLVVEILEEGIDNKELKEDIDAEQLAIFFISCLEGAIFMMKMDRSTAAVASVVANLENYLEMLRRD